MTTPPPPTRRIGTADSRSRAQLVDAAEALLLDEGYAAVTSRRVAARAGLKPQLVHYYFRTMDDLFVEVFRRRADENLARLDRAVAAEPSLPALWRLNADQRGAAFLVEFAALANHRKAVRTVVAEYAERYRSAQLAALTTAMEAAGIDGVVPPVVALVLMTGVTQVMALEQVIGVTAGHEATLAFIEQTVTRLAPGPGPSGPAPGGEPG